MKKVLGFGLLLLLLLVAVLLERTLSMPAAGGETQPPLPIAVDSAAVAQRLAAGLRFATISHADPAQQDAAAFSAFVDWLRTQYPLSFALLQPERVGDHSLLFNWAGSDPALKPALFAAHMDVVPVDAPQTWTQPPFAGVIEGGYVWGRGALDDKSSLLGLLEASEQLLAAGYQPQRSLLLAFGDDEETGGARGAAQIARLLDARGVRLAFTLDEGSAVTQGVIDGVDRPVAAIMAGEKGYVSFRLRLRGAGGHSSTPQADSVIPRMARALARLDARPMPARLIPPVAAMLDRVAPEMPFAQRLAIANRWLLEPVLLHALSASAVTNALIRSTQAITVFHAGIKDNVIPENAEALVNYRLLPGDTLDAARAHLVAALDDAAIEVLPTEAFGNEAPPLSDIDTGAFRVLERTVGQVFPQALVSSGIILATTDNRHYAGIREQGYYFAPFIYTPEDGERIHGRDERIAVADYANMIRFYTQALRNSGDWR